MTNENTVKIIKLTQYVSYCIIYDTIYLLISDDILFDKEIGYLGDKLEMLILNNDILYVNVSGKELAERKEIYKDFGFSLAYYDLHKLRVLYPNKKNKMEYRCYGVMEKDDFLKRLSDDKLKRKEEGKSSINANDGYVSNLLLLFGGIILLCFFCVQGAIYLVR